MSEEKNINGTSINEYGEIERPERSENQNKSQNEKVMEVPSKKRKGPTNITLKVKLSDLPEGIKKDDVIAAIKINGEEKQIKYNVDNIFKNDYKNIDQNYNTQLMVIEEEPFYIKIIQKIKKVFIKVFRKRER